METRRSGTRCRFRLADVICPDQEQILMQIAPRLEVAGEIVFTSDSGGQPDRFAIVEVEGIASPLILPVERLLITNEPAGAKVVQGVPAAGVHSRLDVACEELERTVAPQ